MLALVSSHCELWSTPDEKAPYASVLVDGHRETLALDSEAFSYWLAGSYYRTHGHPVKQTPLDDALHNVAPDGRLTARNGR